MEHEISTTTTLINVAVQAANLILFFLLFKYLFGDKIIGGLRERKELISKLQNADAEYAQTIANAQKGAGEILSEAGERRKSIIDEAASIAKQKSDEMIDVAQKKAESMVTQAKVQANTLENDLKNNYELMVKTTAGSYLKKIFDKEPAMQDAYMDKVSKGFLDS